MSKQDGGPAFPTDSEHQPDNHIYHFEGMSLRDWFAGQAITARDVAFYPSYEGMAEAVYGIADAMIAERNKEAR